MKIHKILAFISALAICCGGLCTIQVKDTTNLIVSAEDEEYQYSGSCGENATFVFDEETGTLTISGTGDMEYYSYNDMPWYDYKESIKTVIIEDGITFIGNNAFCDCTSLENITIPDSVTDIGWSAFAGCTSLKEITIPNKIKTISRCTFMYCTSLEEVNIPNSVTEIHSYAFVDCPSLKSITIPSSVTYIMDGDTLTFGVVSVSSENYYYYEKMENFTIYGVKGSEAERYATENDFIFVAIEEENPSSTVNQAITDILNLKKHILGITTDGTGLDFNTDGKVNILDLTTALNNL